MIIIYPYRFEWSTIIPKTLTISKRPNLYVRINHVVGARAFEKNTRKKYSFEVNTDQGFKFRSVSPDTSEILPFARRSASVRAVPMAAGPRTRLGSLARDGGGLARGCMQPLRSRARLRAAVEASREAALGRWGLACGSGASREAPRSRGGLTRDHGGLAAAEGASRGRSDLARPFVRVDEELFHFK